MAEVRYPGFGGMVSFVPAAGGPAWPSPTDRATAIAEGTRLFTLAESLGGVESLIEVPAAMTHMSVAGSPLEVDPALVRLSVGIEGVDDLIADLEPRPRRRLGGGALSGALPGERADRPLPPSYAADPEALLAVASTLMCHRRTREPLQMG